MTDPKRTHRRNPYAFARRGGVSTLGSRVVLYERNKARKSEDPFRPSANAILLLACIAAAAVWTWLYSDWFALFSSTVGLTALLGVVPTLRGLMSSSRSAKYTELIDHVLFRSRTAARFYLVLLLAILVVGFGVFKPVSIRAAQSAAPGLLAVAFTYDDGRASATRRLRAEPGKPHRVPVLRPVFGGPDKVVVSAAAVPVLQRDLTGLYSTEIVYPVDFWSEPVLLLRAHPVILEQLNDRKPAFTISVAPEAGTSESCDVQTRYLGEPVWLGTGGRALPVGSSRIDGWRDAAALFAKRTGAKDLDKMVIGSASTAGCAQRLRRGDTVSWKLTAGAGASADEIVSDRYKITGQESYPLDIAME